MGTLNLSPGPHAPWPQITVCQGNDKLQMFMHRRRDVGQDVEISVMILFDLQWKRASLKDLLFYWEQSSSLLLFCLLQDFKHILRNPAMASRLILCVDIAWCDRRKLMNLACLPCSLCTVHECHLHLNKMCIWRKSSSISLWASEPKSREPLITLSTWGETHKNLNHVYFLTGK